MKHLLWGFLLFTTACNQLSGSEATAVQTLELTDNELGFSCGFAGTPTRAVQHFTRLVRQGDLATIRGHLQSKSPAYRYMATALCRYYAEKGRLQLTEAEQKLMAANLRSDETVVVCSGCSYRDQRSLGDLLRANDKDLTRSGLHFWIKGMHPE